jgi:hypothetical protein
MSFSLMSFIWIFLLNMTWKGLMWFKIWYSKHCGVHRWFSPDEKRYNSHNILLSKSYVARAVCRWSLLLWHHWIARCGNDEVSLYVATLFLLFLSTVGLVVLPGVLPGILHSSDVMWRVSPLDDDSSDAKPKPSQSVNWGRRLAQSASRRPPFC